MTKQEKSEAATAEAEYLDAKNTHQAILSKIEQVEVELAKLREDARISGYRLRARRTLIRQ